MPGGQEKALAELREIRADMIVERKSPAPLSLLRRERGQADRERRLGRCAADALRGRGRRREAWSSLGIAGTSAVSPGAKS